MFLSVMFSFFLFDSKFSFANCSFTSAVDIGKGI